MRIVLQRVSQAQVVINNQVKGRINDGYLALIGIENDDHEDDIDWIVRKTVQLRVFSDDEGKMNRSITDVGGNILLISQFTLHASTKKGNRPSFIKAARPEIAIPIYEKTIEKFNDALDQSIETGEFGADMKVTLTNDGPVTIMMDSKQKE